MIVWETLHNPYTPPAEVFAAVCAELGEYYKNRGAKYTKSNRRLKWTLDRVRCEIGLNSSHGNMAGEWVNLEIVTSVFAIDIDGMERKGILNAGIRPVNFNVVKIDDSQFREIIACIDGLLEKARSFETEVGAAVLLDAKTSLGNPNNTVYFERYFGKEAR